MGMQPKLHPTLRPRVQDVLAKEMQNVVRKQRALAAGLPTNRSLLAGLTLQAAN